MNLITALIWCERIWAFAIFWQTLELIKLKAIWSDQGVWRWGDLREEFRKCPSFLAWLFDRTLPEKNFYILLWVRLVLAVLVWFVHPALVIAILFACTWLIAIRFRGIFNGGSDSMTALVGLALIVAQANLRYPLIVKACMAYIAVQITASYFLAGLAKVKQVEWRKGRALPLFFETPRYDSPPAWVKKWMNNETRARHTSLGILLLELSFPLAWLSPSLCCVYLGLAFGFHLANFYVFGLNRFVFAWLAGYPALLYWSGMLTRGHS